MRKKPLETCCAHAVFFEIQEVLFRFMRAFDNKDWDDLSRCLFEDIHCDYSSFRDERPCQMSQKEYIAQRKQAHSNLKMQHNLSNISVGLQNDLAEARCNYAIYRFHPEFKGSREHYFHSYGQYFFVLKQDKCNWKIAAITQELLINDGNPELHLGARQK